MDDERVKPRDTYDEKVDLHGKYVDHFAMARAKYGGNIEG
jgi:hypothetical protein